MGRFHHIAVVLFVFTGGGCHFTESPASTYETIEANPRRDTATAIKHNDSALKALSRGHADRAENLLQRALIADVGYAPAHNNLGHLYFLQRRYYHAAWEFEYAAKLMPDRPEPLNNLGLIYEAVGKTSLAVQQYEHALELAPGNQEFASNLARAKIRLGERGFETAALLEQVAFRDDRPDWREWAQEQLHTTHRGLGTDAVISESVPSLPHDASEWSPPSGLELVEPGKAMLPTPTLPRAVPSAETSPQPILMPGEPLP